jgi:hypothetical protein
MSKEISKMENEKIMEKIQEVKSYLRPTLDIMISNSVVSIGDEFLLSYRGQRHWIGQIQRFNQKAYFVVQNVASPNPADLILKLLSKEEPDNDFDLFDATWDCIRIKKDDRFDSMDDLRNNFRDQHLFKSIDELKTLLSVSVDCGILVKKSTQWTLRIYLGTPQGKDFFLKEFPMFNDKHFFEVENLQEMSFKPL